MLKILIPAVAALGLVAHAAQSYTAEEGVAPTLLDSVATAPVEIAPPAPALDWHFHKEGDTAKLAYGVANSDQLVLMLTCTAGDDKVSALGSVRAVAETASDEQSYEDPMTGGVLHEAAIDKADSALNALAATGTMTVETANGMTALGTSASDKAAVKAFFASCGTPRG